MAPRYPSRFRLSGHFYNTLWWGHDRDVLDWTFPEVSALTKPGLFISDRARHSIGREPSR